jgi:hypothetical protein
VENINRISLSLALLSIIIAIGGVTTSLPQSLSLFSNAHAHTFTPDDSASFLALVYRIKNEAHLLQDNLLGNATVTSSNILAEQHANNAISILNESWTKEIAERNRRIANELNGALSDLHNSLGTSPKKPADDIKAKVNRLNDLLDEAISVRLTKDQVNNSTIQALTLANIANKIDRRYANAFGVGYNDMSSMNIEGVGAKSNALAMSDANRVEGAPSGNRSTSNMNSMMTNMMKNDQHNNSKMAQSNNGSTISNKIVSVSDYQSAAGLANKTEEIFNRMANAKAFEDKASTAATLKSSLSQLKAAIDAKKQYTDVMLIIHTKVHPAIMNSFNLKLD